MTINNIGRDYLCFGKLKNALKYLEKAENIAKNSRIEQGLIERVLLHVYTNFAVLNIQLNQLPKALSYALKADSLNQTIDFKKVRAVNLNTIGSLYFFTQDNKNALKYWSTSKKLFYQFNNT
jgi:tetratricopeptide (TPR) repeat protein